jgi:2-polyprenyl-6-methoxyphenol hydroxylase-like FAD-dependent oxidoreductase
VIVTRARAVVVEPGGTARAGTMAAARVATSADDLDADLVVAADGIGSGVRQALFPEHPGLRFAGFATMTTWAWPPAVAVRNTTMRLTSKLAPGAALRSLAPIYG